MAIQLETGFSVSLTAGPQPRRHLVPEGGVLVLPGVGTNVAPPAQLGPLMSPPVRGRVFGR